MLVDLLSIIPTASFIAIVIFAMGGIAELIQARRSRHRLKTVTRALIGEEVRENFGYLQSNYSLFEDIEKYIDNEHFEYQLVRSSSGIDHVWLKCGARSHQAPLRELSHSAYDQLNTTLADLSTEIFKDVHQCYRKIDHFNEQRASIAAALAGDAAPIEVLFARSQISNLLHNRDILEEKLQKVHRLLCKSRMEFDFGKVQVVEA